MHFLADPKNCNKIIPKTIANAAPITVLAKLTNSFVMNSNPFFSCIAVPIQLSANVARNADIVDNKIAFGGMSIDALACKGKSVAPSSAASAPSSDMAPSVPGGIYGKCLIHYSNIMKYNYLFCSSN